MGSVELDIESRGSVLSVTLSDVLSVPDWNEACLISWRKIDMLGRFRMVGEDGILQFHTNLIILPFLLPN